MTSRTFQAHGLTFRLWMAGGGRLPRYLHPEVRRAVCAALNTAPARLVRGPLGKAQEITLSVSFVSDVQMKKLNTDYRSKERTTDVLAFSAIEATAPGGFAPMMNLGDIVISVPQLRRQAREFGLGMPAELQRLLIHGTLHLLGLDHERSKKDERYMFGLQDKAWKTLR